MNDRECMEQRVQMVSDGILLEGLLDRRSEEKGMVITHPHPLYGGDMHNSVVELIKRAATDQGFTTLRFNFRGAGRSQGDFDEGVGEQRDLLAALSYLKEIGVKKTILAGYSFGAWVIATCFRGKRIPSERVMLIAPPIDFLEFGDDLKIPGLALVLCGDRDGFADSRDVKRLAGLWNPEAAVTILPGADHFFSGTMDSLKREVTRSVLSLFHPAPDGGC
jgi:alpha/beta superfamily hydrolase